MTNIKLIDKLGSFASDRYRVNEAGEDVKAAGDVLSFIENLWETNAENPDNDGEDFTSDYHCKGVVGYVLDVGRPSEEFIKELKAIIDEHYAA